MKLRKQKTVVNIDQFFESQKEFWQELEIFCVAECCGIDAYDFSEEAIKEVVLFYDTNIIINDLDQAILFINQSTKDNVSCSMMNHCVSRNEFVEMLQNIKQVLLRVSV